MFKFRQSPEVTSPVKSSLREHSLLHSERRHQKRVLFSFPALWPMAGTERVGGPTWGTDWWVGFLPGTPNSEGWKPPAPQRWFFSQAHQPPQQLFGPSTEPSAERRPTGIALPRFVPISPIWAAFLLQSCTVALGGIPNAAAELLLRADKSSGSSSAASGVPWGSRRDERRDGGCWLGAARIWGLPKAQFQGEPTQG